MPAPTTASQTTMPKSIVVVLTELFAPLRRINATLGRCDSRSRVHQRGTSLAIRRNTAPIDLTPGDDESSVSRGSRECECCESQNEDCMPHDRVREIEGRLHARDLLVSLLATAVYGGGKAKKDRDREHGTALLLFRGISGALRARKCNRVALARVRHILGRPSLCCQQVFHKILVQTMPPPWHSDRKSPRRFAFPRSPRSG